MEEYDEQQIAERAWAFLRSNTTASLTFGENNIDVSYVIIPDGRLVISAMVAMLQPCNTVMYIPEYAEGCMEMHVSLEQFLESGNEGAFADRWQVYHGDPPDTQWAFVDIDAARFHEMFVDGEALQRENRLASVESKLCKQLNANQETLRTVCKAKTGVEVTDPVAVGVDALGVDVRAPFGIIRIPADEMFTNEKDVLDSFDEST